MPNRMTAYLLACADEADRRDRERRKEIKEKQDNCEHKELSRPIHRGLGYYSQHCVDCGKDFGFDKRD